MPSPDSFRLNCFPLAKVKVTAPLTGPIVSGLKATEKSIDSVGLRVRGLFTDGPVNGPVVTTWLMVMLWIVIFLTVTFCAGELVPTATLPKFMLDGNRLIWLSEDSLVTVTLSGSCRGAPKSSVLITNKPWYSPGSALEALTETIASLRSFGLNSRRLGCTST